MSLDVSVCIWKTVEEKKERKELEKSFGPNNTNRRKRSIGNNKEK